MLPRSGVRLASTVPIYLWNRSKEKRKMVRSIAAVLAGGTSGFLFNMALVILSSVIYPMPQGVSMSDSEAMRAYVSSLPPPAFAIVLVAHAGGALVGGLVAALIGKQRRLLLGGIVGGLFLIGGIMNAVSLPGPLWFTVLDLILYIPCGLLGARLLGRGVLSSSPVDPGHA